MGIDKNTLIFFIKMTFDMKTRQQMRSLIAQAISKEELQKRRLEGEMRAYRHSSSTRKETPAKSIACHGGTMSDDELGRSISEIRTKMNETIKRLQSQTADALNLMEIANKRYMYAKQQHEDERQRAEYLQNKVDKIQARFIEDHNIVNKMFDHP